jgi:hypothetical protein
MNIGEIGGEKKKMKVIVEGVTYEICEEDFQTLIDGTLSVL